MNTLTKLNALKPEDVAHVYSGRPGCCCGCRGKHTYSSLHVAAASKSHGCDLTGQVNDRVVKSLLTKMQNLASDASVSKELYDGGSFISVDLPTRIYIVYLANKGGK